MGHAEKKGKIKMTDINTSISAIPDYWKWFSESRFGLFIHWGAYSVYGRGEQVLFREHLDQNEYTQTACAWNPSKFDATAWADTAKRAGIKYAVLTTRHHDGFCLWDSKSTDYTTAKQTAGRDFVREYVDAFRATGLKVGLYYSLADWRIPAYWEGPANDPEGWQSFKGYVHDQVRELLTDYGMIDMLWFDGDWPHSAADWGSVELIKMIKSLQPHIMVNNRLGSVIDESTGQSIQLGDFGTPEHEIKAESNRMWESCQVSTWRLWGYTIGERWRPADVILDMLVESAGLGGNLLLNVGPDSKGQLPVQFIEQMKAIGQWLDVHGECIYGSEAGDVCEFVTYGYQTKKGNNLYLVIRFWDGCETLRLAGLETKVQSVTLLTTGKELSFQQSEDELIMTGLPKIPPTNLFPVIRLECVDQPIARPWAKDRLWCGDPRRMTRWAQQRGSSVYTNGNVRPE